MGRMGCKRKTISFFLLYVYIYLYIYLSLLQAHVRISWVLVFLGYVESGWHNILTFWWLGTRHH